MKIVELVAKVETLSMEEIDELVDNGIEIEDIYNMLLHEDESIKQGLFKNEKLNQFLIKEMNSYILELLSDMKNNPNEYFIKISEKNPDSKELSDNLKKIVITYLKNYFKEGMELEITSEKGRKIVSVLRELKDSNTLFSKLYKDTEVWSKYSNAIRKKTNEDIFSMSKSEAFEYNKTFAEYLNRTIVGSNIPEAEAALKITQRDDSDLQRTMGLDYFVLQYGKQKNNKNIKIMHEDEVISILLEYEVQLKNKGIEKEIVKVNSLIEMVEQQLRSGQFGTDNTLSKKEFACVLKLLRNLEILESEANQKLSEVLGQENIQLNIGRREINELLEDTELFEQICEKFPNLKYGILKQIENDIDWTLTNIANENRRITPNEMNKYSNYLKNYFDKSIEMHGDSSEMLKLFCLMNDIAKPEMKYNVVELTNQPETLEF